MIFTIVDVDTLNSAIPNAVVEYMGYSGEPTLIEKVLIYSELDSGFFAISVNMKAEGKECAWTDLSSEELKLAALMYDELLTEDEYKNLDFKEIEFI